MFMAQQAGEACVGGLDGAAHVLTAHIQAKRQGVDENPQGALRGVPAVHAAHQHRAEHHLGLARQRAQHPRPTQVEQAGDAHPQQPRLGAQALVERVRQRPVEFVDAAAIALHVLQAKGQGRLGHIPKHLPEERLMLLLAHPQPRLGHVVAKRHRRPQLRALALQERLHFVAHHLQGAVVEGHVMEQQHRDDALLRRVRRPGQA